MRARIKSVAAGCRTAEKKKTFSRPSFIESFILLYARARGRKLRPQVFAGGISRALAGSLSSQSGSLLSKGRSVHRRDPLCKSGGQRCASKSRWRGIKSY